MQKVWEVSGKCPTIGTVVAISWAFISMDAEMLKHFQKCRRVEIITKVL